ncbi:hypothetical protein GALMADRAFT_141240 [Galerina marginata CBS 339.88]|uniref:Uncharacterized protein n=1 Tax=Galerina marginata (strain CBS 339.88) TaxID=685588 RepID=A0A067SY34_GALM3|nr:hypothetical protein GALMADRAFT_141240 [Galerina marginata CBS 339.88]
MNVIAPILSFSVRILRVFMPKDPVEECPHNMVPRFESGGRDSKPLDITQWARSMKLLSKPGDWEVTQMQWFKNTNGLEHEYLVIKVHSESLGVDLYLRFDRRATAEQIESRKLSRVVVEDEVYKRLSDNEREAVAKAVTAEQASLPRKRDLLNASKKSSSSEDGFVPEDTLVNSRHPNGQCSSGSSDNPELLATYSNFRYSFPLRDLALVAGTIVDSSDGYLILVQQCYWLARTIVGVSVEMYIPERIQKTQASSRAGKLTRLPFLGPVNLDNPKEIATLSAVAKKNIAEDDKLIHEEYMKGRGGVIQLTEDLERVTEQKAQLAKDLEQKNRENLKMKAEIEALRRGGEGSGGQSGGRDPKMI